MTIFSFPAVQAGDAMTVEIINGVRTSFQDFADGATGAPRIRGDALADDEDFLIAVNASDDFEISRGVDVVAVTPINNTDTYEIGYSVTVTSYTGSIRFSIDIDSPTGYDLRISKTSSGSTTVLQTWSGSAPNTRTIDVPVAAGDVVFWEHRHDGGITTSTVSNPTLKGDTRLVEYTAIDEGT